MQPCTVTLIEFIAEYVDHKEQVCTFSYSSCENQLKTHDMSLSTLQMMLRERRTTMEVELDGTRVLRGALPARGLVGEIRISPTIYRHIMRHIPRERTSSLVHWKAPVSPQLARYA